MRLPIVFLVLLAAAISYATPVEVSFAFEKAFIPDGFDDNDNAQVVLAGTLPDTCYQTTRVEFALDESTGTVKATQWALAVTDICLPATVPFSTVLSLGNLRAGEYAIEDGPSGKSLGKISIRQAKSPTPDEYTYAPLTNAFVNQDPATGETELVLRGDWMDRCSQFKQVDVEYQAEVVVVKPIIEGQAAPSRACGVAGRSGFEKRLQLQRMPGHTYLLHVRSASGRALNKLIYQ